MSTRTGPGAPRAPMRSLLVRNVLANVVARGLSILGWLAITPWVLRALGPERFGFWSLLSMLASTALLLDLGLGSAVTRYVAHHGEGADDRARNGAFTAGVWLAAGLALLWAVAGFLGRGALLDFARVSEGWRAEAWAASGLVPFAAAAGVLSLVPSAALAGVHRLDLANRVALAATAVQLSASVWVLREGGGLPGLTAAMALGSLTSLVAGAFVLRAVAPRLRLDPGAASGAQVLEQMRFSAALQVISLGVLFQFQLPKLALARWSGLASVGEFELGYRVAFAAWSLPSLLLPPLLPAFTELTAQGRWDSAWALHQRAGRYLLIVALPIAVLLAALSAALYGAWLGPGHAQAALTLSAVAGLLGINVLTSASCLFARAVGRPWMEAGYHMLSFGLHVTLLAVLVPRFGLAGGLAAMLVSGTVATFQFLWVFHRAFQRSGREFVTRIAGAPALAALAGGAAAWLACAAVAGPGPFADRGRALLGLAAGGGAGLLVTLVALFAVRAVTRAEIAEILRLVPRPGGAA